VGERLSGRRCAASCRVVAAVALLLVLMAYRATCPPARASLPSGLIAERRASTLPFPSCRTDLRLLLLVFIELVLSHGEV
jgi:hypothetical protein